MVNSRISMIPDGIYYIVLADLAGSTGYMAKMGNDAGIARFREFERAAREALEHALFASSKNTGAVVKTVGDAVLLVFSHFPDIVEWYLEFDGVLIYTPTNTKSMMARVWVHIGELRFEEGDLNGLGVSDLFKIEKKAKETIKPGSFIITDLAKGIAEPALFPKHCALKYRKTVKLIGYSPVKLYQLMKADLPFLFSKQLRERFRNKDGIQ